MGLLRHDMVMSALRDPAAFASYVPELLKHMPKLSMVHDDPPYHTHLRRLVNKAFSAQRVALLAEPVGRFAQELLDAAGRGPMDFMAAYAVPLPMRVIAQLLGVPAQDYPSFKLWTEAVISYAGMPAEERTRRILAMREYMRQVIAERRVRPADDLLSSLVEATLEGTALSDEEIQSFAAVLLVAGNETTTNLIGNMMALLADRPELWRRAREDRSLVEPIIEEVLRYESPVQRLPRVTARPVRMGEVEIPAGEMVDIYFGAATGDPAVFQDPEEFQPGRPENAGHVAFGYGIHFCLGATSAPARGADLAERAAQSLPHVGAGARARGAAELRSAEPGVQGIAAGARLSGNYAHRHANERTRPLVSPARESLCCPGARVVRLLRRGRRQWSRRCWSNARWRRLWDL